MSKIDTIIKLKELRSKMHNNPLVSDCNEIEQTLTDSIEIIEGTLDTEEGLELPREVIKRIDYPSGAFYCPNCNNKIGEFYHVNTKEVTRCSKCNQRLKW